MKNHHGKENKMYSFIKEKRPGFQITPEEIHEIVMTSKNRFLFVTPLDGFLKSCQMPSCRRKVMKKVIRISKGEGLCEFLYL